MTDSRHIAPHLREHIFRGYEPYLTTAVAAWPNETSFTVPDTIASATFLANLRNAVISLIRYSWSSTVDREKLIAIESPRQFVINFDSTDNKVWFRHPPKKPSRSFTSTVGTKSRDRDDPPLASALSAPSASLVPWRDWTSDELHYLCMLIHTKRLTGPFILDGQVSDELMEKYMLACDVAIIYDAERKQTVIT